MKKDRDQIPVRLLIPPYKNADFLAILEFYLVMVVNIENVLADNSEEKKKKKKCARYEHPGASPLFLLHSYKLSSILKRVEYSAVEGPGFQNIRCIRNVAPYNFSLVCLGSLSLSRHEIHASALLLSYFYVSSRSTFRTICVLFIHTLHI